MRVDPRRKPNSLFRDRACQKGDHEVLKRARRVKTSSEVIERYTEKTYPPRNAPTGFLTGMAVAVTVSISLVDV